MIYLGSNEYPIYLGDSEIPAIYAGDLLIYPTTVTGWSVSPISFEEKSSSGSVSIRITSLSAWTISSSESWITFSQDSGDSGRTTVIATYEENVGDSDRTATITVTDGTNTSTIDFLQNMPSAIPGPFMFNYNAKTFNASTNRFLKTDEQLFDEDLVIVGGTIPSSAISTDSVIIPSGRWMGKTYSSTSLNPMNRSSSNSTFTFVYKTSGFTSGNQNLFANRTSDSSYNYMVRPTMFHTNQSGFLSLTPSANPQIVAIRIQANGQSERKVLDADGNVLQSVSASSITWGGLSKGFGFFSGYGNSNTENFNSRFYWMYCSLEALTDADIKKVIDYNEGL